MLQAVSAFRRGLFQQPSISAFASTSSSSSTRILLRAISTKISPKRDPERPIRPSTPFFLFLQDFRKSEAAKALKAKEVVAAAGTKWKTLPEPQKSPFAKAYESKKVVYDNAFKQYKESGKLDAWKRDPTKPKRPLSGFLRFCAEYRQKNATAISSMKVTEVMKHCSAAWKNLGAEQKAVFDKAYKSEKEKFDKDMNAYKASGKEQAFKEKTGVAAAEKKAAMKKQQDKEKLLKEKKSARAKLVKEKSKVLAKRQAEREKVLTTKQKQAEKLAKAKTKATIDRLQQRQANAKLALKSIEQAKKKLLKTVQKSAKTTAKRASRK